MARKILVGQKRKRCEGEENQVVKKHREEKIKKRKKSKKFIPARGWWKRFDPKKKKEITNMIKTRTQFEGDFTDQLWTQIKDHFQLKESHMKTIKRVVYKESMWWERFGAKKKKTFIKIVTEPKSNDDQGRLRKCVRVRLSKKFKISKKKVFAFRWRLIEQGLAKSQKRDEGRIKTYSEEWVWWTSLDPQLKKQIEDATQEGIALYRSFSGWLRRDLQKRFNLSDDQVETVRKIIHGKAFVEKIDTHSDEDVNQKSSGESPQHKEEAEPAPEQPYVREETNANANTNASFVVQDREKPALSIEENNDTQFFVKKEEEYAKSEDVGKKHIDDVDESLVEEEEENEEDKESNLSKTSIYKGVYWNKEHQKWRAQLRVNKKKTKSGGYYTSELDAAHGVNALCDDHGVDRKHPGLGDPPSNWKRSKRNIAEKTSTYKGVYWNAEHQKWQASVYVNKKLKYGGCYTSELDAAHGVNALCDDLGVDRKHPELGDPPSNWKRPPYLEKVAKSSKYKGVCWNAQNKQWQASIMINKDFHYGGKFESETSAARMVNMMCENLGIPLKNPLLPISMHSSEDVVVKEEPTHA